MCFKDRRRSIKAEGKWPTRFGSTTYLVDPANFRKSGDPTSVFFPVALVPSRLASLFCLQTWLLGRTFDIGAFLK